MNMRDLYFCKHRATYLKFLSLLCEIEVKTIAEIGVWDGENARILLDLFPNAHLYLIDSWEPSWSFLTYGFPISYHPDKYIAAYHKAMKRFQNHPQATIIKKTSLEAAPEVPNELDLVFIDADHSYSAVKEDILTWEPKVRSGGILSGHDYWSDAPEVIQAVNDYFGEGFLTGHDGVWATIKK